MPTIAYSEVKLPPRTLLGESAILAWGPMANGDQGDPISFHEFADKSVQITGDFGGGSGAMQGSNDATNPTAWFPLTDPQGNPITKTSDALEQISEQTVWVRPVVSGGSAGAVTFKLMARKGRGRAA